MAPKLSSGQDVTLDSDGPNAGGFGPNLNGNDSQDWVQIGNGKPPKTPARDSITPNVKRYGRGMRG